MYSPLRVARFLFAFASWGCVKNWCSLELARLWARHLLVVASALASCSQLRVWVRVISGLTDFSSPRTRLWSSFTHRCELTRLLLAASWMQVKSCALWLVLASGSLFLSFYSPLRVSFCTKSLFSFFAQCLELNSCTNGWSKIPKA
jgi:hypothetical protein